MVKTCDKAAECPPYIPCTCAHKCDCECHGAEKSKPRRTVPSDPDAFNTTSRDFYKPHPPDATPKKFIPTDCLSTDPNVLPMTTEMKREYTPKKADRDTPVKQRTWRQNEPFDPSTTFGDTFRPPKSSDYPERVGPPKRRAETSQPGTYETTSRGSYVKPDSDMYTPLAGTQTRELRASPPGIYDTEYNTQYVDFPRERSVPFKGTPMSLGSRPADFTTTNRGAFKPPSSSDYPTRTRSFSKPPPDSGPLSRLTSTSREDYKDPGRPGTTHQTTRPRDSTFRVGPNSPMTSTTHSDYGPKKHFCCGCAP